jgi:hypothetical protein
MNSFDFNVNYDEQLSTRETKRFATIMCDGEF